MERLCILLLDDSPLDRFIVRNALIDVSPIDFHLLEAERLSEALTMIREEPADLILTDLNLPDSLGLEPVSALSKVSKGAPLWVLTGHIDPEMEVQLSREGACGWLSKDRLDTPTFRQAIDTAIQHKNAINHGG